MCISVGKDNDDDGDRDGNAEGKKCSATWLNFRLYITENSKKNIHSLELLIKYAASLVDNIPNSY